MEKKIENKQHKFGLIGKNISYSFSRSYFGEKFRELNLHDHSYENFDIQKITAFKNLLEKNTNLKGLNVTIPYKEEIIPFLTSLDKDAEKIGAVNTIKFVGNSLIGYNTDAYGFQKSIEPFLKKHHEKALILGTGGASKAIGFVFSKLGIAYKNVSRQPNSLQFTYSDLSKEILSEFTVIVNCTPLGTHPNVEQKPKIPYQHLTHEHLLFDLIYNPEKTAFLQEGASRGAAICNGHLMLKLQAEKSWSIWND
jgi:shikimate dehydrogenase